MPSTTQKLVKNATDTVSLAGKIISFLLTVLTNPVTWLIIIIVFFPFTILNYISLYFVNIIISFFNLVIYGLNLGIEFIWGAIVSVLNIFINILNGLSYTINLPAGLPNITIDPFNFSLISPPGPNTISYIPYKTFSQVEWLDDDQYLLKQIIEWLGW